MPAAGALLILLARVSARGENVGYNNGVKLLTLLITIATFGASLFAFAAFDYRDPAINCKRASVGVGASYAMGVDTLAMSLVMLTTFLTPICILASWVIEKQVSSYMVLFLILESLMIGVFCTQDIEFLLRLLQSGLSSRCSFLSGFGAVSGAFYAALNFCYTLLGSLLMLVAIIFMIPTAGTSNIQP